MSARYLMALEYADLHAKQVLSKHKKNRPLGDIESKIRFQPPQPVLSCRTVDIDVCGTRTYRAKSTIDIIDEQQRLIHDVYTRRARTASSAPTKRLQPEYSPEGGVSALQSLKINGSSGRPDSSPPQRPTPSPQGDGYVKPSYLRRPKTTGSLKKAKPVTDSFLRIKVDSSILESSKSYHSCSDKIHEQWEPENHALDEGKFVRGKKRGNSAKLDQSGQWLSFAGGNRERSTGVVDAFTSMKDETEYYTIEGSVGGDVARQVRRGDRIRIGINGVVQSHDLKVKKWVKERKKRLHEINMKREQERATPRAEFQVPLCWADQLDKPDSRIIHPHGPRMEPSVPNLCETYPVVYNKQNKTTPLKTAPSAKQDGYKVKSRVKSRKWAGGTASSSNITSLNIDQRSEEEEMELDRLTSEEIVQSAMQRSQVKPNESEKFEKFEKSRDDHDYDDENVKGVAELTEELYFNDMISRGRDSPEMSPRPLSRSSDSPLNSPSKSRMSHPRPVTATYCSSPDPDLVSSNLLVSSGRKDTPQTPDRAVTPRSASGVRPTPSRPLHKAIPSVASISPGGHQQPDANLGYIQFSKPLHIAKDQTVNDMPPVPGASSAAIQHISDHNKMEYTNNSVTPVPQDDENTTILSENVNNDNNTDKQSKGFASKRSSMAGLSDNLTQPSNTPAPSRAETPEHQYRVVAIPTGESFPDSGHNSVVDMPLNADDE